MTTQKLTQMEEVTVKEEVQVVALGTEIQAVYVEYIIHVIKAMTTFLDR